jgi:hypothetical protein
MTITVLDITHRSVFYLKPGRFGDWILSPSSDEIFSDKPSVQS